MGMFDSLYDNDGNEFQTKAFERLLTKYHVGDKVITRPSSFQVEILGGSLYDDAKDSYATVVDGTITAIDAPRDESLALVDYYGNVVSYGG